MTEAQPKRFAGNGSPLESNPSEGGAPGASESDLSSRLPRPAPSDDEREHETLPAEVTKNTAVPLPGRIEARVSGRTDVGLVREHNEDNFAIADLVSGNRDAASIHAVSSGGLLFGVCDGMGGAAAGEVASQMAIDTILEMMRRSVPAPDRDAFARALVRSIEEAGERIFEAARTDRSRRGMGTTATIAALMDKTLFVGQVGDSRAYILRAHELKQITKDQSLVNQLIEAGQLTEDEAEAFEHSNIILQALGTTEQVSVDLTFLELRAGDRLLMCSDGLSGLVHSEMIREVMLEHDDLDACGERLIELAKAGGGHDNVTVIVAAFGGEGLAPPQPGDLAGYQQYPLPLDNERAAALTSEVPTLAPPSGRAPAGQRAEESDDGGEQDDRRGWTLLWVVAIVLALGSAIYWLLATGQEPATRGEPAEDGPKVVAEPVKEVPRVEVVVRTDVEAGELVVDGEPHGAASEGRWVLQLSPGPHKLEARALGTTVTSSLVSVREGVPAMVFLSLPEGADMAAGDASEPLVAEPPNRKREGEARRERHRRAREAHDPVRSAIGEAGAAGSP